MRPALSPLRRRMPKALAALAAGSLVVTVLLPLGAASAAGSVAIAPEREGDRAVRAGQFVTVSGSAAAGPITSAELVGIAADGGEVAQTYDATVIGQPASSERQFLRSDDGQLSGRLVLTCLFNDPAVGSCPGRDEGVVAVRLDLVAGGEALSSPTLRVDYTRPVITQYRVVAPRTVEVRFSEPVRSDDSPLDWSVREPDAVVTGVRSGTGDCGYLPATGDGAGRADRDGCTRLLDLAAVTPLPEDATPLVSYVPALNRPLPVDDASNALDRASSTNAASRALDVVRPAIPSVSRVDGDASSGAPTGRSEAPAVEAGGLTSGHAVWVERVPAGGEPVRGPQVTASGSTASLVAPTLPADGAHVLRVVAQDPSGNRSTDSGKTPPRSDGSPNPVTYVLDRVAPVLLAAAVEEGKIRVTFSEPVSGPDDPDHWAVRAPDREVTAVEGDGASRLLTVSGGAPAGALLDYTPPADARYADPAGNPVADVVGRVVDGLRVPTVSAPAGPLLTKATSVPVAGTARPGATVEVFRDADRGGAPDGPAIASAPVAGDGRWSASAPLQRDARNDLLVRARAGELTSPAAAVPPVTQDGTAPALSLTSPTGGEVLAGGRSSEVEWTTSDTHPAELRVELALDGATWTPLATVQPANGDGSLSYVVPDVDTTTARVRLTAVDGAGNPTQRVSGPFTIDAVSPVFTALTTSPREVVVTFSEPVSGRMAPGDWRVAGAPATVSSAEGAGSSPLQANSSRVVVLRPSVDVGPDARPEVRYAPALGELTDRSGQGVDPLARTVVAADGIRPPTPEITAVDGRAPSSGRVAGSAGQPTVELEGVAADNVVAIERVPATGSPVRGPETTAAGSPVTALAPPLPADGEHVLRAVVRDPSGNLSTDSAKTPAPADRSPSSVTYLLDSSLPRLLSAVDASGRIVVRFSEPVTGRNDPTHWTLMSGGQSRAITAVEGSGAQRTLTVAGGIPAGAQLTYRPSSGRYADASGNAVPDARLVVGVLPAPVVQSPAQELLTRATEVEVRGTSVPGATVDVFRDLDADGSPDGAAVASTRVEGQQGDAIDFAVTVPLQRDTRNRLLAVARDGNPPVSSPPAAVPAVVHDATAPTLSAPGLPGEDDVLAPRSSYDVRWTVCDANLVERPVVLSISVDDGATWRQLRDSDVAGPSACRQETTASIVLPSTETDRARLRLVATDLVGLTTTVVSDRFGIGKKATPGPKPTPSPSPSPSEPGQPTGVRDVTQFACPPDQVQDNGFTDVDGNLFELEIDCLADHAFTRGVTADRYVPQGTVTRRQMALFVHRLGEYGGVEFDGRDAGFTDLRGVDPEVREAVNGLANAGVVRGRSATSYDPAGLVSRDQMASFLARLQGVVGAEYVADQNAFSDDDGNVHEENIDRLAAAGVVQGIDEGSYNPFGPVSRQQMAGFLMRYVDDRIEAGDMSSRYTG